ASTMPDRNRVQATADRLRISSATKLSIRSNHDDDIYVTHALTTGAQGYLLKEMDADALIEAIKVVDDGGSYLHPKVTHNLVQEYRRLAQFNSSIHAEEDMALSNPLRILTKRECEVLQLLA